LRWCRRFASASFVMCCCSAMAMPARGSIYATVEREHRDNPTQQHAIAYACMPHGHALVVLLVSHQASEAVGLQGTVQTTHMRCSRLCNARPHPHSAWQLQLAKQEGRSAARESSAPAMMMTAPIDSCSARPNSLAALQVVAWWQQQQQQRSSSRDRGGDCQFQHASSQNHRGCI
jgi:hypothetical protein